MKKLYGLLNKISPTVRIALLIIAILAASFTVIKLQNNYSNRRLAALEQEISSKNEKIKTYTETVNLLTAQAKKAEFAAEDYKNKLAAYMSQFGKTKQNYQRKQDENTKKFDDTVNTVINDNRNASERIKDACRYAELATEASGRNLNCADSFKTKFSTTNP